MEYNPPMASMKEELAKRLGISLEEFEKAAAAKKKARREKDISEAAEARAREHLVSAVSYPGARPMALADAQAFIDAVGHPPANPEMDGVFDPATWLSPSVQRIEGPLELDELHLAAEGSNLYVDGSLTVRGILKQDFRAGGLIVRGDLFAQHIVTTAEIACTGSLEVPGTLFGNCTNYCTNVWGPTRAGVIVSAKEHYFSLWGGFDADVVIDTEGTPSLGERADHDAESASSVLLPNVDLYDEELVFGVLRRSGTLLA